MDRIYSARQKWITTSALLGLILLAGGTTGRAADAGVRGAQFVRFPHPDAFEKSRGAKAVETVLTSPVVAAQLPWNELIASWNADTPGGSSLQVEARAIYSGGPTRYYILGRWSSDPGRAARESVPGQKDEDGKVLTDTLALTRACERFQLRVTLSSERTNISHLTFLGVTLSDTRTAPSQLAANRAAWGRILAVPERSQMAYTNGNTLCSPTTVSMLLGFWAKQLGRPELDQPVPVIAQAVNDPQWPGTGNWPFNMAYAGSRPGLRGYVARFSDVSEIEDWIAQGLPVGLSLCYDRLRGKPSGPNGHLVVCVGFTKTGDPIINDPGTSSQVRKIFPRARLIDAWAYSHQTTYLVYPKDSPLPADRFGHWDSWSARQRVRFE